jgi:hypothetical protein
MATTHWGWKLNETPVNPLHPCYATEDPEFLRYLRGLTRFFVLLTSPDATSTLIQAFVFGWVAERVTFLVEIVAACIREGSGPDAAASESAPIAPAKDPVPPAPAVPAGG